LCGSTRKPPDYEGWKKQTNESPHGRRVSMTKQKKPKIKIKFDYVPPALRNRLDMDYVDRIPDTAKRYLKKFIEEIYGRKFQEKSLLGKDATKRSEIHHETYAAKEDFFHVCVRINVDPTLVDIQPTDIRGHMPKETIEITAEVERVYEENGVKITRYKPVR
jgi:hypothetical protein